MCEKGAIGTHTKGILDAFSRLTSINKIHLVGADLGCINNQPKIVKYSIEQSSVPLKELNFVKKIRFYKDFNQKLFQITDKILKQSQLDKVIIYHRYSVTGSHHLIKHIRKNYPSVKLILEYNDKTVDQFKFGNLYGEWTKFSGFLRTNKISLRYVEKRETFCFKNSDLCLAVTDKLKEYISALAPNSKVITVTNATDITLIEKYQSTDKLCLRQELGLSTDVFYFAHIGTFTFWDGILEFLEAFRDCSVRDKCRFLLIGYGSMEAKIRNFVEQNSLHQNVEILPAVDQAVAQKYLASIDAVPLLKTIATYQLCPIKFYETLGLGKLLITTDIPYINSIKEMDFGATVSLPLKKQEIISAIEKIYSMSDQLESKRKSIIKYAKNNHTWDLRVKEIMSSVNKLNSPQCDVQMFPAIKV